MEEHERHERARVIRKMLEAGADLSLELDGGDGAWANAFVNAVENQSQVNAPLHN